MKGVAREKESPLASAVSIQEKDDSVRRGRGFELGVGDGDAGGGTIVMLVGGGGSLRVSWVAEERLGWGATRGASVVEPLVRGDVERFWLGVGDGDWIEKFGDTKGVLFLGG